MFRVKDSLRDRLDVLNASIVAEAKVAILGFEYNGLVKLIDNDLQAYFGDGQLGQWSMQSSFEVNESGYHEVLHESLREGHVNQLK